MNQGDLLKAAISKFGTTAKSKLSNAAIDGAPEDQIRAPLESLMAELAAIVSPQAAVQMVGETSLKSLALRPDYAVTVQNALIGFIEVKAPGKGADPRHFTDQHDKDQWKKLKSLPNLIYTDGNGFSLWRDGVLSGNIVTFTGDIRTAGQKLEAPQQLLAVLNDFLQWTPIAPTNPKQLAEISARLCRLLRAEVAEQIEASNPALTDLQTDWRKLLFPDATNDDFADGYAQAVTFGLLVARANGISIANGIHAAAHQLRTTNSLIGTSLQLLTDHPDTLKALHTSLGTLVRVLEVIDWPTISKGDPEAWLYFYEQFLEVYDNVLRKKTGSYYTPPQVVETMIRLVDETLRHPDLFDFHAGLASSDIEIADPAMGTGTFLLGILRCIRDTIAADQGLGAVPAALAAASRRLIGFEVQFGPFAVAQLRLIAEMFTITHMTQAPNLRLMIADTLSNPFVEDEQLGQMFKEIARSRQEANTIKRESRITVVIGNPPYKERAKDRGGWIEQGSDGRPAPFRRWVPPAGWGVSAHAKHLRNLYVYFWRWATWKVFGDLIDVANKAVEQRSGIVCFITVAGFLNGPGFEKMRDDLRRTCSDIWVIDCSPEGHQPDVPTRIFQGVQQPVCIVLAARVEQTIAATPASVRFRALPRGKRETKFNALASIKLDDPGWIACRNDWRAPFLPEGKGAWQQFPALDDLFIYNGSGVMPGRTWIIAPDAQTLSDRWKMLVAEKDLARKEALFHPHMNGDKTATKPSSKGLVGHEHRAESVASDTKACIEPIRYAFRSFDREWIIPDNRLINRPNPTLWTHYSDQQIYLTALKAHAPSSGPAITFAALIPDLHHYKGNFGGRAFPLWADDAASNPNIKPALLAYLSQRLGTPITAPDVMAYLAAVMAHPGFTARFKPDLVQPGLRVPITADATLFAKAAALGREIIWLHSFGTRFTDQAAGRPRKPPRLPEAERPSIPETGAIPGAPDPLPEIIDYDPLEHRIRIGAGCIDNVRQAVWDYEISGMSVIRQWFSYRRRNRTRPVIGDRRRPSPLEKIQPQHWLAEYTADLIDLLNVLGRLVALETRQADVLNLVLATSLINTSELEAAGALLYAKLTD